MMKKWFSIVLLLLLTLTLCVSCDNRSNFFWKDLSLEKDQAYLVYRGTNTKQGGFARDFNIKDTLSSHLGLLIKEDGDWFVHHVLDFADNGSDYKAQSLKSFYDLEQEHIFYAAFWRIESLNPNYVSNIKQNLKAYQKLKIRFDKSFSIKDSLNLYCSEFVYKILSNTDMKPLLPKPYKTKLKGIYKTYFDKDTLEYYPIDIFQSVKRIKKIKEWHFE